MRYFYIDTENVNPKVWVPHLANLCSTDTVIVLFTQNSHSIPVKYLPSIHSCQAKLEMIHSAEGTKQALDFTLVAALARRTVTAKKSCHYIVSADNGYNAAIQYLLTNSCDVKQVSSLASVLRQDAKEKPK